MPPRYDLFTKLRRSKPQISNTLKRQPFHSSQISGASTVAQKRRGNDPYALAQARARKAANLSRREVLTIERSKALGDPIRGIETPFTRTLDPNHRDEARDDTQASDLNNFVKSDELQSTLVNSQRLSEPVPAPEYDRDPQKEQRRTAEHKQHDQNAHTALQKILGLEKGSSKDWMRNNIQRCIEEFGRHNTDKRLKSRYTGGLTAKQSETGTEHVKEDESTVRGEQRAGPDTGSPEVQVAILTSRIMTLAHSLNKFGKHDKMNKRNLRLLVHRRQKLLNYLRSRERGSERWSNLVQMLGLTEGTWKGEISL
ncbi:MAG: hypothetical protein M1828_005214 [Chrysothrix sp. TS-e1954]|nr:MAG: hypothetical protein M1828_005214 [Chrysothrix sp. TS-e1954]